MTNPPRIPLSPTELPRQRVYEVVALPARPDPFDSHFLRGNGASGIRLPKTPGSPQQIVHCEWAWSPMHSRIAAWYLHRSRSHWVLWIRHYDDNWEKWDWDAVVAVPLRQASEEEAATHLLIDAWERERSEMSTDKFHWINVRRCSPSHK
jgi:hypothetical protein